ncbi:MAG: hypothetical protein ACYC61_24345 [Isosphaeraceae bacterium]
MTNQVDTVAAVIRHGAHSFDFIRSSTGLELTDDQFRALVGANRGLFKLVRFLKRDGEGRPISPGRPGVRLRAEST